MFIFDILCSFAHCWWIDGCCGYPTVTMSQDITRSYNSQALIAVCRDMTFQGVQADVWRTLCDLGIAAQKSTKRGRRGGVKRQREIAVITGFRPRNIIYDRTEPGKIISATNKNLIPVQLSANLGFHMTTKVC